MSGKLLALVALAALLGVEAHGNMTSPQARNGVSSAGNNKGNADTGPCGDGNQQTKGAPSANLVAGQSFTVQWDIEIPHGGDCQILLSSKSVAPGTNDDDEYAIGGNGALDSGNAQNYDLSGGSFPCANNAGTDSREVTIPTDVACDNCILQWYWSAPGDGEYFNCADVTVLAAGGATSLLSPDLFSSENTNTVGLVLGIIALISIVGFIYWRMKGICGDGGSVAALGSWPSRVPVALRGLEIVLYAVVFGLTCAVNSFYNSHGLLFLFVVSLLMCFILGFGMYKMKSAPEAFGERKTWKVIFFVDFAGTLCTLWGAFNASMTRYATWIIEDDRDESFETQLEVYNICILFAWVAGFVLLQSLLHSMGMLGWCLPSANLGVEETVSRRRKSGYDKKGRRSGGSSNKRSGGSNKAKRSKKRDLASQDSQLELGEGSRTDAMAESVPRKSRASQQA